MPTDPRISHGGGQMRAQSFSVQVSTRTRCNAGCQFCISRTTPGTETPDSPGALRFCDEARLRVGLNYARALGATHAILTGKADPTQEDSLYLTRLIDTAREYLPLCDMHTNGFLLQPGKMRENLLAELVAAGLTMVTFSVASFDPGENRTLMGIRQDPRALIAQACDLGLLVRCSLVMNERGVRDVAGVLDYVKTAGELGAHMVVVREVWRPKVYGVWNKDVFDWNHANAIPLPPIQDAILAIASEGGNPRGLQVLDPLPWGTPVLGMGGVFRDPSHGVNLTFALCEEATVGAVLKSVVHMPDGHGYRNWNHKAEILY